MILKIFLSVLLVGIFTSCSSFKAERVDNAQSDEKSMDITDEWMSEDTKIAMSEVLKQMREHKGFKSWLEKYRGDKPKIFVAEVQNQTAEAYFPIDDMNDEFLTHLSNSDEYVLVDAKARDLLLKEITYQNDGMVDPSTAKKIGKQTGADLLIFGTVYMKPQSRKGKTIKEYSVNIRMTDLEKGVEVMRSRTQVNKFSKQSSFGW